MKVTNFSNHGIISRPTPCYHVFKLVNGSLNGTVWHCL